MSRSPPDSPSVDASGADPPRDEDFTLLARTAAGDCEAFEQLVRRHQARVLALAYRFLGRRDTAEDVCQDAFIRVFERARFVEPRARFTTWLYRIVANLCWDARRRGARDARARSDPQLFRPTEPASPPPEADERLARVRRAVAALPDRQRLAVLLHRFDGLGQRQIAEVTGWSIGAVESCLVRAYASLRESLSDLRGDSV